jgi:hypothetical protein
MPPERLTIAMVEIIAGGNHQLSDAAHRRHAIRFSLDWIGRYL